MTIKKGHDLTPQQNSAIELLLTSRSIKHAADTCGLSYKTLRRWLADPQFKAALIAAEGETLDCATRRLASLGDAAVETMAGIMAGGENESTRLRAAQSVLDNLLKMRELRGVEERLAALESEVLRGK